MQISQSRFTADINPENVYFSFGDIVKYQLKNGNIIKIKIDSELMKNKANAYGYESIFFDDNKRYFAESKRIIDWEGKNLAKIS